MSDTQNKWVPVSERLPEKISQKLVRIDNSSFGIMRLAYLTDDDTWRDPNAGVVWMDLPEPPPPPKPTDPFEAFWDANKETVFWRTSTRHAAKQVWDAAKEYYAKPLPDFETWWRNQPACGSVRTIGYHNVKDIWNAAQGKPEA